MKERGILFSAPMVRAILEGRKTQTRRLVKPQPEYTGKMDAFTSFEQDAWRWRGGKALIRATYGSEYVHTDYEHMIRAVLKTCPYSGNLWVKETHRNNGDTIEYKAGGEMEVAPIEINTGWMPEVDAWRPSLFMPRWASRITLEIVAVRVERLQEITEEDAKAEGVLPSKSVEMKNGSPCYTIPFQLFWTQINGCDSWDKNPFVYVITFRKLKGLWK